MAIALFSLYGCSFFPLLFLVSVCMRGVTLLILDFSAMSFLVDMRWLFIFLL